MGKLGQGLALAGALGAFGCEEDTQSQPEQNLAQSNQQLSADDILNMGQPARIPWSIEGDSVPNLFRFRGRSYIMFSSNRGIGPSYVECDEITGCVEPGIEVKQVLGIPEGEGSFSNGYIYTNANGQTKLVALLVNAGSSMVEFDVDFNANNQLTVLGEHRPLSPELPAGGYLSYFETEDGTPSAIWNETISGTVRNLLSGEDTPVDPSGNTILFRDYAECGSPGVDTTGTTWVSKLVRDANGEFCRVFYADSLSGRQNALRIINSAHPDEDVFEPRSLDNVFVYQTAPGDNRSYLNYAIAQPVVVTPDAGTPDAAVEDAAVADAGTPDAAPQEDAAVEDAAVADAGTPDAAPQEDAAVEDAAVVTPDAAPREDAAVEDAAVADAAPREDAAVEDAAVPDAAPQEDAQAPDVETPDSAPQEDAQTPDAVTPDAEAPQELAPFEITLLTGNCVKEAAQTVKIGAVDFTKIPVKGDGTQDCEIEIEPEDGKAPFRAIISNDRDSRMKVSFYLPFDANSNVEAEANTANTTVHIIEDPNGQHVNLKNLGVVTASAASEFLVTTREASVEGHEIFEVASFNKPEEPVVFVTFLNGSRLEVPSNGRVYVVDIDTGAISEKLPEIPECKDGDPNCEDITPPPTGQEEGGKSGCDCSVGGRTLPQGEFFALLGALALAARRKRK